jgi:hypothetical protein
MICTGRNEAHGKKERGNSESFKEFHSTTQSSRHPRSRAQSANDFITCETAGVEHENHGYPRRPCIRGKRL